MTDIQIAWLAGLLEGEGCFRFDKRNSPKIQLQMTDEDVVKRVARMLSVNARAEPWRGSRYGSKTMWRVDVFGDKAIEIMHLILPFMGERRFSKIESVINARRKRRSYWMVAIGKRKTTAVQAVSV